MNDARADVRLPADLKRWAMEYARRRRQTLSQLIYGFLKDLREREIAQVTEEIVVHDI